MAKDQIDLGIRTLVAVSTAAVLLMAAFAIPPLGMAKFAFADDDDDDDEKDGKRGKGDGERSSNDRRDGNGRDNSSRNDREQDDDDRDRSDKREFSRLFDDDDEDKRNEDRKPRSDPKGDSPFLDLDIKNYGFIRNDAYIEVYGTAGGTVGEHDEAIAYVLSIITTENEKQTWAIDSHEKQHGDSGTGEEWHAHRVHLTDNPLTPEADATCLNEVDEVTHAMMDGNRVIFEEMRVGDDDDDDDDRRNSPPATVNAKIIHSAASVRLKILVDDPDNPPAGTACIANVVEVYDTADLNTREHDD